MVRWKVVIEPEPLTFNLLINGTSLPLIWYVIGM